MPVYVDEMFDHGKRIGRAGPEWAHLVADTEPELHAVASLLGFKRSWFQGDGNLPHYDIGSWPTYHRALELGAVQLTDADWLHKVRDLRRAWRAVRDG